MPADAAARSARHGGRAALAAALCAARVDTLSTFAAYEAALPGLVVPQREHLNPPLWELGHIGWFQGWWTTRFAGWRDGWRADPALARCPPARPGADALYDSSAVAHTTRWTLPLPDAAATRADLARQLEATLAMLANVDEDGAARDALLYPFRLVLLHEDMHHEAALYMARELGVPVPDPRWQPHELPDPPPALPLPAGRWILGRSAGASGFAFDNECGRLELELSGGEIDAQPLRWAEFLPFAEDGGYDDRRWWTAAGWAWRTASGARAPRRLRRVDGRWWRTGPAGVEPLPLREAAVHLTQHEALAWCRWAGRRLPTEAEWEAAALTHGTRFAWGEVWEWTASAFAPWPGFQPHPYRDYSAPWFDGRPVLRGASHLTQPRLRDVHYRNYFPPHRADVPAGLRTCAARG